MNWSWIIISYTLELNGTQWTDWSSDFVNRDTWCRLSGICCMVYSALYAHIKTKNYAKSSLPMASRIFYWSRTETALVHILLLLLGWCLWESKNTAHIHTCIRTPIGDCIAHRACMRSSPVCVWLFSLEIPGAWAGIWFLCEIIILCWMRNDDLFLCIHHLLQIFYFSSRFSWNSLKYSIFHR